MQSIHMPRVDARYWLAITVASVFGTNLGDFYAHESGFDIALGLGLLAVLAAAVFIVEKSSSHPTEAFYWLVIIIIRTGATNIADYLAFRAHIPGLPLSVGLATLIALFALLQRRTSIEIADATETKLSATGGAYWSGMLSAGVFGTVVGDICQRSFGQGVAAVGLGALLAVVFALRGFAIGTIASYWFAVAVARTTGTALGDWLAESRILSLGLSTATLISGIAFVAMLALPSSASARSAA